MDLKHSLNWAADSLWSGDGTCPRSFDEGPYSGIVLINEG